MQRSTSGCASVSEEEEEEEERLTGDEEHDSCGEGAVEPLEGGEVGEGHDPGDDAREARHGWEDHEGPGGVPVSWRETGTGHLSSFIETNLHYMHMK